MVSTSSIARDRSVQSTSGKYKRRGSSDTVNSKVPLHERTRQLPDEDFIVREGKLFCNACRQILCLFLKARIPIAKTDMLRSLSEKNGYRLTGSSNLGQYVSIALKQEIEQSLCVLFEIKQSIFWNSSGIF